MYVVNSRTRPPARRTHLLCVPGSTTRPSRELRLRGERADDLRLLASHHVGGRSALGESRARSAGACPAPARARARAAPRPRAGRRTAPRPSPGRCRSSPTRSPGGGRATLDQPAVIRWKAPRKSRSGQLEDPPRLGATIENPPVLAEQIGAQRGGAPIQRHEARRRGEMKWWRASAENMECPSRQPAGRIWRAGMWLVYHRGS